MVRASRDQAAIKEAHSPRERPEPSRGCRMSFLCATMIISGAPSDLAFFSAAQAAILPYSRLRLWHTAD